jgi:WD40 repeat protein
MIREGIMSQTSTNQQSPREELQDWLRFLRAESTILNQAPGLLFQQAANQPTETALARKADERWRRGLHITPWMRRLNPTPRESALRLTLAQGPNQQIHTCRFWPEGRLVVGCRGEIFVWDISDGSRIASLRKDGDVLALSPDGKTVAAAGWRKPLVIWNVTDDNVYETYAGDVRGLAFFPDGRLLSVAESGADMKAVVWDLESQEGRQTLSPVATLNHGEVRPVACATSPEGSRFVTLSQTAMSVWDAHQYQLRQRVEDRLDRCRFLHNGNLMVAGPQGIRILDLADERELSELRIERPGAFDPSPDGALVAIAVGRAVQIWNVAEGKVAAVLGGHADEVQDCSFAPSGRELAAGDNNSIVRLWDVEAALRCESAIDETPASPLSSCAISPASDQVAVGGRDGTVSVWDVGPGSRQLRLDGHRAEVTWCCFSQGGDILVSGAYDGSLRIWDVRSGAELRRLKALNGIGALSPDGERVALAAEKDEWVIADALSGSELLRLPRTGQPVWCQFLPDSRRLAVLAERKLSIWDLTTVKLLRSFTGVLGPVAFSRDGETAVFGSNDQTELWELSTGSRRASLTGDNPSCCALSTSRVVVAYWSGVVRVFDVKTGSHISSFLPHQGPVRSCAISEDSQWAATSSYDPLIVFWDLAGFREACNYWVGTGVSCLDCNRDGSLLIAGTDTGELHMIRPEGFGCAGKG